MKLLHGADFHLGLARYGRANDLRATWKNFVAFATDQGADVVVIAGDVMNSRRDGPDERATVATGLRQLREAGIPTVLVPGNHDGTDTLGEWQTHAWRWLSELNVAGIHVPLIPTVGMEVAGISFTTLPYPHKRTFDAQLASVRPEERVLRAGVLLGEAIEQMAENARRKQPGLPQVFVGHLSVGGAKVGSEAAMRFSWDIAVTPQTFAPFDYAALGHIHNMQRVTPQAAYAGSPERMDFGEANQEKGFLLVDIEPGVFPTVKRVPSGARPMLDHAIRLELDDAGDEQLPDYVDGSLVRVVLAGPRPPSQRYLAHIRKHFAKAAWLKLEQRTEREEVARVTTEADLDIMEATRRHLVANGVADVEAVMDTARHLAAQ